MTDLFVHKRLDARQSGAAALTPLAPVTLRHDATRTARRPPSSAWTEAGPAWDRAPLETGIETPAGKRARLAERICVQREALMGTALSLCRNNPSDAEDLVQETLLRALDRIDSLRDEERLKPWTRTILLNLVRDRFRRKDSGTELSFDAPSRIESPEHITERGEFFAQTRGAIEKLSPRLRQVVGLVCIAELSYAEAAEAMDVPIGTVMSRLSRARKTLQPLLKRYDIVPAVTPTQMVQTSAWSWEGSLSFSEIGSTFC